LLSCATKLRASGRIRVTYLTQYFKLQIFIGLHTFLNDTNYLLLFVSDGRDEDSQSAMAFIIGVAIAVIIIILVIIVVGILCCRRSRYTVCMLPKSL